MHVPNTPGDLSPISGVATESCFARAVLLGAGNPLIEPKRIYTRYHSNPHTNAEGNERMGEDVVDFLLRWPVFLDLAGEAASKSRADLAYHEQERKCSMSSAERQQERLDKKLARISAVRWPIT